jgi:hypothetical protein
MSKLSDLKLALEQLKTLGLPISREQMRALQQAEDTYVETDIIPSIKEKVKELFSDIDNRVKIVIEYDGNPGHDVNVYREATPVSEKSHSIEPPGEEIEDKVKYKGLRVTFPDGKIIEGRGFEVLITVVNEVGPDLVNEMGITYCGLPLVDDHRSDGPYGRNQRELTGGYWLLTNQNVTRKKKIIDTISKNLDLGLKCEVLNENVDIVNVERIRTNSGRSHSSNLKVTTPEGEVFFHDKVWETLRDVVLLAGTENVRKLGLINCGIPLVDDHITQGTYASQKHEIAPNVFLNTYSDTRTKMKQIKIISDRLHLNLSVELV